MRARVAIAIVVLAGVLLRLRALVTELWLDEIWSLRIAQEARSWTDIFTRLAHDNNHPLNTLFLYLLGEQPNWIWYRALSFLCGLALVALLIRAARNDRERIAIAVFASFSLPIVVYSTEARGYAMAAMLCVAAYVWRERPLIAAIAITIALFAHLTSVFILAGLIADAIRRKKFVPYAIPLAALAFLYITFIRNLHIGGGPPGAKLAAAIEAAAQVLGGSGMLVAVLAIVILVYELVKRDDRLFFIVALFAAPAIVIACQHGEYMHARYFFVCLPFALLLLASFVTRMPAAGIAIGLIWIIATAAQFIPFLRYGRGTYIEAMQFMKTGVASGDNDFRNGTVIAFYQRYARNLVYGANGDWYLIEAFGDYSTMPRAIRVNGEGYTLVRVFPYGGVSGWTWLVYRRDVPPLSNPASIQR